MQKVSKEKQLRSVNCVSVLKNTFKYVVKTFLNFIACHAFFRKHRIFLKPKVIKVCAFSQYILLFLKDTNRRKRADIEHINDINSSDNKVPTLHVS